MLAELPGALDLILYRGAVVWIRLPSCHSHNVNVPLAAVLTSHIGRVYSGL